MALAALALIAALVASPDLLAPYAKPGQLIVLADGRALNLVCMGQGAPAVVLEAGWSSWSLDWAPVQARLAETTRVCAYDRAGLGFSSADPRPKTLDTVVADLTEMLDKAGVVGPLVLVGGSKGAVFARAFAAAHPDRITGLVLIDPGSPERDEAFLTLDAAGESKARAEIDAALKRCVDRAKAEIFTIEGPQDAFCADDGEAGWSPALKTAYRALQRSVAYAETRRAEIAIDNTLPANVRGPGVLGDRPLIVLKADDPLSKAIPEPRRSELDRIEKAVAANLAQMSRRGQLRTVSNSGHMVAQDRPDAVIEAVEAVVAEVRQKTRP